MIEGASSTTQALLGTLFTWFVTALGAAGVFVLPTLPPKAERRMLDVALGFAGGVMLAASFWSLLDPAIEASEDLGYRNVWFPPVVGIALGVTFVLGGEHYLPDDAVGVVVGVGGDGVGGGGSGGEALSPEKAKSSSKSPRARRRRRTGRSPAPPTLPPTAARAASSAVEVRRLLLLVLAITVHNFPEGLAVGVGFGSKATTFAQARNIAIGVGIQNFPEGLAVALPLRRLGFSKTTCFFVGQLSGAVEPIGGVLGAYAVGVVTPLLPYALAFAAGAMIYVVLDSAHSIEPRNTTHFNLAAVVGFIVMMTLDVAFG